MKIEENWKTFFYEKKNLGGQGWSDEVGRGWDVGREGLVLWVF